MRVNEGRILGAGRNYQDGFEGLSWYEQGLVVWSDCSYGSVTGVVNRSAWGDMKAWVGIENGLLTFECEDCRLLEKSFHGISYDDEEPDEPEDILCPHAVAVALAALDQGAEWYELPKDAARPKPHENADELLKSGRRTLLSRLEPEENSLLLQRLLQTKPELTGELERFAVERLNDVSVVETAYWTREALKRFRPAELPAFFVDAAGEITAEYQEEDDEDAWDESEEVLMAYSLKPLVGDMVRRCTLGAAKGARAVAVGIVAGLYQDRDEPAWTHPMTVKYLGDELLVENALTVLNTAAKWGVVVPESTLNKVAPEWVEGLKR